MIAVIGQVVPPPIGAARTARPAPPVLSDETLRKLKQARDGVALCFDLAAQRKSHARKTIEDLRHQMDRLALVAALNPKAMAKLLHKMVKQLAAAVHDYAASGDTKELQGAVDAVEAHARSLEQAGAPPPPANFDAAKAADETFVHGARQLHKRLQAMFELAIRQAAAHQKDHDELAELAKDFAENDGIIIDAEQAITEWWPPTAPASTGGGVNVVA